MPAASTAIASDANIARHLGLMAAAQPDRAALKIPRGRTAAGDIDYLSLTFAELDAEAAAWTAKLTAAGVKRGDRTLVMVRQGLPLIAAVFGTFRLGAVPVVIDPGMGLKSFLAGVARSQPRALIGVPFARMVSRVFSGSFRSVAVRVPAASSLTARLTSPGARVAPGGPAASAVCSAADLAAILFTSGSTGAPKGVCYEHGMFEAQVRLIRNAYGIEPGEIDLPLLPIFALFNPALGMTTVVPEIDPKKPADLDPAKIVQAIRQEGVTNSFGSPTLWQKIVTHCHARGERLPSLRRVLCAGAPVPMALWKNARAVISAGQLHSPYGATEALPVASVSADEIDPNSVRGACVGRVVQGIDVKIIAITDGEIATLADARECRPGEIGEIIVAGPVVTRVYDALPAATGLAKIPGPAKDQGSSGKDQGNEASRPDPFHSAIGPSAPRGAVWHRMGDCGYFDDAGRLWFCGRKVERVETALGVLHTEPCEQVFREHPRARRCALIGLGERGRQRPAIVVEAEPADSAAARSFARDLRALALRHEHTKEIRTFYFHARFPVDVRHNAKIHRLTLAKWARQAKGYESDPKR